MKETDATTMTRYLLGQLPDAERDAREQEWFVDKALYVQLCEAETALIDAYVRGELGTKERGLFEQQFLTIPARRDRVQTARALVQTIDQSVAPTASWWQRWFAGWRAPQLIPAMALAGLVLAGGLWMYSQRRATQEQLTRATTTAAEQQRRAQELEQSLAAERAANTRLTEELARRNNAPAPQPTTTATAPKTLLFALTAGVLRSEESDTLPTLRLARDIARVQLQVKLPAHEYQQFTATLRTAEGRAVQRWTVKAAHTQLTLSLAAQQLKAGDYVMIIQGIKVMGEREEFRRVPFKISQ